VKATKSQLSVGNFRVARDVYARIYAVANAKKFLAEDQR
jgi:hypothetical protein